MFQQNDIILQNQTLQIQKKKAYVFFIYTDKQIPQYSAVFDTMKKCLDVLKRKAAINENPS